MKKVLCLVLVLALGGCVCGKTAEESAAQPAPVEKPVLVEFVDGTTVTLPVVGVHARDPR